MSDTTLIDYSKHAGAGMENITSDDLQIPFLQIVQTNSAEVDKGHADYPTKHIEGVESGDIIDTVSRTIVAKFDQPLNVIPTGYYKAYVEWRSRDQGGGIVQVHKDPNIISQCTKNDNFKDVLDNGNEIVTTAYFTVLYENDGNWEKAIVSMSASQLKKAKMWLSKITSIKLTSPEGNKYQAPIFSHKYSLTSITQSNNKGSWFGWKVDLVGAVEEDHLVEEAVALSGSEVVPQLTTEENPF